MKQIFEINIFFRMIFKYRRIFLKVQKLYQLNFTAQDFQTSQLSATTTPNTSRIPVNLEYSLLSSLSQVLFIHGRGCGALHCPLFQVTLVSGRSSREEPVLSVRMRQEQMSHQSRVSVSQSASTPHPHPATSSSSYVL